VRGDDWENAARAGDALDRHLVVLWRPGSPRNPRGSKRSHEFHLKAKPRGRREPADGSRGTAGRGKEGFGAFSSSREGREGGYALGQPAPAGRLDETVVPFAAGLIFGPSAARARRVVLTLSQRGRLPRSIPSAGRGRRDFRIDSGGCGALRPGVRVDGDPPGGPPDRSAMPGHTPAGSTRRSTAGARRGWCPARTSGTTRSRPGVVKEEFTTASASMW